MITNSLEWSNIEIDLLRKANKLSYGRDLRKMIYNIHSEVSELARAEVEARRGHKHKAEELLIKINQDMDMVREYILVAALIG